MKLKQKLKHLWEYLVYNPTYPQPEIKEMLEKKGYKFVDVTHAVSAFGGVTNPLGQVFNKEGQRVHYDKHDPESEQYCRDYDEAEAAYRAPKP